MNFLKYILILLLLTLSSCGSIYYTSLGQNVSLLKKKGEMNVSGNITATSPDGLVFPETIGLSFNASGAISDHLAIHASHDRQISVDSYGQYFARYYELGLGGISLLKKEPYILEVFAGTGYLWFRNSFKSEYYWSKDKEDFLRPYIQPSFGVGNDLVVFAFTPRFAYIHNLSWENSSSEPDRSTDFENYVTKNIFAFEPGLTIHIGKEFSKFRFQYVYSIPNYPSYIHTDFNKQFLSFGVVFMINQKKDKQIE